MREAQIPQVDEGGACVGVQVPADAFWLVTSLGRDSNTCVLGHSIRLFVLAAVGVTLHKD